MSALGETAGFAAYKIFSGFIRILPRPLVLALGRGLGRLMYGVDTKHRRIALDNLAIAFGREKSPAERKAIARASFGHFVRTALDSIKFTGYSVERICSLADVEGRENLVQALAMGKGVLIFSAHYGNWEVAPSVLSAYGPVSAVARALDNRLIERDLLRLRRRQGASIIYKSGAGRHVIQALAQGGMVGIVVDQNVLRGQAVFVDFFGRAAATTPGLAGLHFKSGAPLLPMFCHPRGPRYLLRILPPVMIEPAGCREEDVLKATGIYTKMIEEQIRREPEPWLWIHKRWNTRPADEKKNP
jgi:Kdo2-lipid IVA lauroyltransferase/acyltransferase